ncbi:hypothetical protein MBT84_42975 [Streptomyces sp. MBT84]|nr:hypothetical protein [Streptomyces sp. MBT84]
MERSARRAAAEMTEDTGRWANPPVSWTTVTVEPGLIRTARTPCATCGSDAVCRTADDRYPGYAGSAGRSPRPLRPRSRSSRQPARSTARTSEGRHRAWAVVRCRAWGSKCPLRRRCSRALQGRSEPVLGRYSFPGSDMAVKEKHRKSSVVLCAPNSWAHREKPRTRGGPRIEHAWKWLSSVRPRRRSAEIMRDLSVACNLEGAEPRRRERLSSGGDGRRRTAGHGPGLVGWYDRAKGMRLDGRIPADIGTRAHR